MGEFKWMANSRPIEREINDDDGNVATIKVRKFSEKDIRAREKFLGEPVSTEEGRRGRSARGRGQSIQLQRVRQFNFERGLVDWPFIYPDMRWDEENQEMVKHPKAGQKVPVNRTEIENLDASISEQINDILNEVNEPPAELPELRDEEGNLVEEAQETPTELSFAAR